MNRPSILILAPPSEPSAQRVRSAVENLGGEVVWLNSRDENPVLRMELGTDGHFSGSVLGVVLEEIRGVLVRSVAPRQPRLRDAALGKNLSEKDWIDGLREGHARRDAHTLLLHALAEKGAIVLNPPRHGSVLEHKALQLQVAIQLGFRVPRTAFGTLETVSSSGRSSIEQIHKPLRGGAYASSTADFSPSQMLIEQPRVRGADIRVFCVNGRVVLCVEFPEGDWTDHRSTPAYQSGSLRFTSCNLDFSKAFLGQKNVRDGFENLAIGLQLPFMALDFKRDQEGRLWFLEANGAPVFADVDDDHEGVLSEELAAQLLGNTQS
ncbi:MAG: hypothetical protein GY822_07935 [Deltaproteobacteria bacterium]|nr:hypothetical protein [Deltaproteobacteria bacterium]